MLSGMASIPEQWAARAQYDLDTARAMLDSGRYLYVLFCCQQAVERMLKGRIAKTTNECPPRLHSLTRLAGLAKVDLESSQEDFLRGLSNYYIQTRYPAEIEASSQEATREIAREIFNETEETMRWLSSMT